MPELSPTASTITARTLEQHRPALTGHCYRMLGSAAEADDAVQETMVRAWKNLHGFEGRSSLRTWLYRIATRVCLDALEARGRRMLVRERGPSGGVDSSLDTQPGTSWIEPIADAEALPADADPDELLSLRQSIRLAFVAALQHLPPRQRAMLLLTDVLGWSAAEAASCLEVSVAAVNSALQRARATLSTRDLAEARAPLSPPQLQLVDRYVDAFERYDMDALTALLHADATMAMPPHALWFRGHPAIRAWLTGPGAGCRGSRLIRVAACDSPAFAHYKPGPAGGHVPWSLIVLELAGDGIAAMTYFLDTQALFPRFGLPLALP
jgi:RNA polymerase sigma-70 factor (ECF subfamily)